MNKILLFLLLVYTVPAVTAQNAGCVDNPKFNDFDFWLGEWDVTDNSNGNVAGTNHIEKQLNNCMLMESWNGASGSIGKSINYYNPLEDRWRQLWVAPGYIIDISGGLVDGAMTLVGNISYFNDTVYEFRGTWTPGDDGSVRQFFEQYDSQEEIWVPWFDGRYVSKD